MSESISSGVWTRWQQRLLAVVLRAAEHRRLLAALSFAAGVYSFVSLPRSVAIAQWLAVLLGTGWVLMLLEVPLNRRLGHLRWARLSRPVMRYAMQTLHQDTFFFCLPILCSTTTWRSGQAVFTVGVGSAALCAMLDPLYYGVICARPWLYFAFHAFAVYVAALTLPPILWQLTTTRSLALASVAIGVLALPSLIHRFERRHWRHWAALIVSAAALGGASWLLRYWVPPATLWVGEAVVTQTLDAGSRAPGAALKTVSATQLSERGLYAYTAIHAPRGLHEQVFHLWRHDGRTVDRIPLHISGGREQGYRAWSYKRSFPADAVGRWTVQVVTDAGQLIGETRFRVVPGPPVGAPAAAPETIPAAGAAPAASTPASAASTVVVGPAAVPRAPSSTGH